MLDRHGAQSPVGLFVGEIPQQAANLIDHTYDAFGRIEWQAKPVNQLSSEKNLELMKPFSKPAEIRNEREDAGRERLHQNQRIGFGHDGGKDGKVRARRDELQQRMRESAEKMYVLFEAGIRGHRSRNPLPAADERAAVEVEAMGDEIIEQLLSASRVRVDQCLENGCTSGL